MLTGKFPAIIERHTVEATVYMEVSLIVRLQEAKIGLSGRSLHARAQPYPQIDRLGNAHPSLSGQGIWPIGSSSTLKDALAPNVQTLFTVILESCLTSEEMMTPETRSKPSKMPA